MTLALQKCFTSYIFPYNSYCRLIFETPPGTIDGLCTVTNNEGSTTKVFRIKLVSKLSANILLSNKLFWGKVFGRGVENDTFEVEKSELVEFTLEKMKKLREVFNN